MPTTTQRGYGHQHQKLRKWWAQQIAKQGAITCWKCGHPIHHGDKWDLGHDPNDRTQYRGPEHQHCNRATNTKRRTINTKRVLTL